MKKQLFKIKVTLELIQLFSKAFKLDFWRNRQFFGRFCSIFMIFFPLWHTFHIGKKTSFQHLASKALSGVTTDPFEEDCTFKLALLALSFDVRTEDSKKHGRKISPPSNMFALKYF